MSGLSAMQGPDYIQRGSPEVEIKEAKHWMMNILYGVSSCPVTLVSNGGGLKLKWICNGVKLGGVGKK